MTVSENIIHKEKGTTRDWHKSKIKGLKNSTIYDSPGVMIKTNKSNELIFSQLLKKIDIFFYVVDYRNKNNDYDKESINELRKFNKTINIIINKDDNFQENYVFSKIGFNRLFYISCSHNLGFDQLYTYLERNDRGFKDEYHYDYSIAIYGKPNAGKSTLANSLLGFNRIVTSSSAGTTSDIVEDI